MGTCRPALTVCCAAALAVSLFAQEGTYAEFRRAFNEAREAGDQYAIDRAIRLAPNNALIHFVAVCHEQRRSPPEVLRVMKGAWRRVYGNDTVLTRYQSFYGEQSPDAIEALAEAEAEIRRSHILLSQANRSGARPDFERSRDAFAGAVQTFARLGDHLHAARAWQAIVHIYDSIPDQTEQDRKDMLDALERFAASRQAWSWTGDAVYEQNFLYLQELRFQFGNGLAAGVGLPFEPEAGELELDLKFAALDELEVDMFAQGGPVPPLWPQVQLIGESYAQLPGFKSVDLFVRRDGNRYWINAGTAASDDVTRIRASRNPRTSEFPLDEGGTPYAMWFFVGGADEPFMSADLDYTPSRDLALVHYRSAASWTTTIDREKITFYDDNCDGRLFITDPYLPGLAMRTLGEVTPAGTPIPSYDSMRIGRNPRIPFSEIVQIGTDWYSIRGLEDGVKVGLRRLDPRRLSTGKVKLEWQHTDKTAPEVLVIQCKGAYSGAAYDISSGDPIEVPVGEYEISFGRIVVGRGGERQLALIFRGDSETFTVEKGSTFELEMGAPFSLDYEREGTDTELVINSTTLRVLGRSGAVYSNLHNAVPAPKVLYSRESDGTNPRRVGEFRAVRDPEIADKFAQHVPLLGSEAIAFPLPQEELDSGSPVLRARIPADVLVGLHQERHPLFGTLIPVWKGHHPDRMGRGGVHERRAGSYSFRSTSTLE